MAQCPTCFSFNDPSAAFCNQCGRAFLRGRPAKRRPGRRRSFLLAALLALLAGAALISRWGAPGGSSRRPATLPEPGPGAPVAVSGPAAPATVDQKAEPLTAEALLRRMEEALVRVELFDDRGERLREIQGVVVESPRTILCRFRPLLGAYSGVSKPARVGDPGQDVVGLVAYDPYRDLAVIDRGLPEGFSGRPARAEAGARAVAPGMEVVVASHKEAVMTRISEYPYYAPDGSSHARLEDDLAIPAGAFLALNVEGAVVGLCAAENAYRQALGSPEPGPAPRLPPAAEESPGIRYLLDPLTSVAQGLGKPATITLTDATRRFYEGSSADFMERARRARKARDLPLTIELLGHALDQAEREGFEGEEVQPALDLLHQAIDEELERRRREKDLRGSTGLLLIAVERFPSERRYWIDLAEARLEREEHGEAIAALLEARGIEPGPDVDSKLQQAYVEGALREVSLGRLPAAADWLEKGLQALPGSARIHLELARLYQRWGLLDDAARVYERARALDPGLAGEVEAALERIEDQVRRREALVLEIPPGSSTISAEVVLNGAATYRFIIDTGATFTAITQAMADALGYQVGPGTERVVVSTANGIIDAPMVVLDSVYLQGYAVRNVKAVVLPHKGSTVGLLGLNFLDHFRYSVDSGRREFRLEKR